MSTISSIIAAMWFSAIRVAMWVATAARRPRLPRPGGGNVLFVSSPGWPVNVFDPAEYLDGTTAVRIRVEVIPHVPDEDFPIRLVITDTEDNVLTELKFTPTRAKDTAVTMGRLLSGFIPSKDSWRLAEGLRTAAIKVWAQRN